MAIQGCHTWNASSVDWRNLNAVASTSMMVNSLLGVHRLKEADVETRLLNLASIPVVSEGRF
jgi:hypothetical protein